MIISGDLIFQTTEIGLIHDLKYQFELNSEGEVVGDPVNEYIKFTKWQRVRLRK